MGQPDATTKCHIEKVIWSLSEAKDLLGGSDTMAKMMRHSRTVSFPTVYRYPLEYFTQQVSAWVADNTTSLCAIDRDLSHQRVRLLFEDKADLAKFLLLFTSFETGLKPD